MIDIVRTILVIAFVIFILVGLLNILFAVGDWLRNSAWGARRTTEEMILAAISGAFAIGVGTLGLYIIRTL